MVSKQMILVFTVVLLLAVTVSAKPSKGRRRKGPEKLRPCSVEGQPQFGRPIRTIECDAAAGFTCSLGPFTRTHGEITVSMTFCVGADNDCPPPPDPPKRLVEAGCEELQADNEGYSSGKPVCNAENKYAVYSCSEQEKGQGGHGQGGHGWGRRGPIDLLRPCIVEGQPQFGRPIRTIECDAAAGFTCSLGPFTRTHGEITVSMTFCVGADNDCPPPPDPTERLVKAGCEKLQADNEEYSSGKPVCNAERKYVVYSCPKQKEGRGGRGQGGHGQGGHRQGGRGQ